MSLAFPKPAKGTARAERLDRRACPVCGSEIKSVSPSARWTTRASCSPACEKVRRSRKARCATCGVEYRRGTLAGRFCSSVCYRASVASRPMFVSAECERCGRSFRRTAAAIKRVKKCFCSRQCRDAGYSGAGSPHYRGGHDPNRGPEWRSLAAKIRARDGHCCLRCGKTEAENGARLEVDHIRPWRSFEDKAEANHPDNLVSLCKACHCHKSMTVERAWLRGDRIALVLWVSRLGLDPSTRA